MKNRRVKLPEESVQVVPSNAWLYIGLIFVQLANSKADLNSYVYANQMRTRTKGIHIDTFDNQCTYLNESRRIPKLSLMSPIISIMCDASAPHCSLILSGPISSACLRKSFARPTPCWRPSSYLYKCSTGSCVSHSWGCVVEQRNINEIKESWCKIRARTTSSYTLVIWEGFIYDIIFCYSSLLKNIHHCSCWAAL